MCVITTWLAALRQKSDQVANKRFNTPFSLNVDKGGCHISLRTQDFPTFRHKIPTYSGISGDIEGEEPEKSEFQVVMKLFSSTNRLCHFPTDYKQFRLNFFKMVPHDFRLEVSASQLPCKAQVVVHQSIENTLIQYMSHTGRELKCPLSSKKALSASTNACV